MNETGDTGVAFFSVSYSLRHAAGVAASGLRMGEVCERHGSFLYYQDMLFY